MIGEKNRHFIDQFDVVRTVPRFVQFKLVVEFCMFEEG